MGMQPILVMTGNRLRHRYFAIEIGRAFSEALVVIERQPPEAWGSHVTSASGTMQSHFTHFSETEREFFQDHVESNSELLKARTVLEINDGEINDSDVLRKIREINPRLIAVLSTSLLSPDFIDSFSKHTIINLHAGLSPYYRGSGTNVFPFCNNELQYVGMTVHYLDAGIDSGDVILQGRPVFDHGDDTHTIGCKNVILGTRLMVQVIEAYLKKGPPKGRAQNLQTGRLYYKKDFDDATILKIRRSLEGGIVDDYVRRQPVDVAFVDKISHE
jgi:folate-dependent phosphoribosylglycinamide formyltransferase PurN